MVPSPRLCRLTSLALLLQLPQPTPASMLRGGRIYTWCRQFSSPVTGVTGLAWAVSHLLSAAAVERSPARSIFHGKALRRQAGPTAQNSECGVLVGGPLPCAPGLGSRVPRHSLITSMYLGSKFGTI